MAKKFEHWCDGEYDDKETKFVIGEMAENLYKELENYMLYDIRKDLDASTDPQDILARNYIVKRFYSMLDNAEKVELNVKSANSIYALYGVDYEWRRKLWIASRSYCFQLIAQLKHITPIMIKGVNIRKYTRLSKKYSDLSVKIKNIMVSDDTRKKKSCRQYLPIV